MLATLRYVNATSRWFWHNCERAENGCRTLNYGKMRCRTPCSMLMLSLKDKLFSKHVVRRFLLLFIGNSLPFSNINKLVIFPFHKFFLYFMKYFFMFKVLLFHIWMKFCKIKFIEELRFCLWIPSDCFQTFFTIQPTKSMNCMRTGIVTKTNDLFSPQTK